MGGHSPLLQRSQNFLLSIDALELVTLPSGPGSPLLQADSACTPVRSSATAMSLEIIRSIPVEGSRVVALDRLNGSSALTPLRNETLSTFACRECDEGRSGCYGPQLVCFYVLLT